MICSKCSKAFEAGETHSIDTSRNPELKAAVMDGSLFVHKCPYCGKDNLTPEPVLYHDPDRKILIAYTNAPLSSDGLEGYTCRRVASVGDLIEKVKIFESELDDIAVELAKFITCQEMKKDVPLKFLKMDGADGEITLTYPEGGNMEMIVIGYNVYSDCEGIVSRNPQLQSMADGLTKVDRDWIAQFIAE